MARTKTNFQAIKEVKELWMNNSQIKRGIISTVDMMTIEKICEIKERSVIELNDLRDFAVILLSEMSSNARQENDYDKFDKINDCMSALVHVIDAKLFEIENQ